MSQHNLSIDDVNFRYYNDYSPGNKKILTNNLYMWAFLLKASCPFKRKERQSFWQQNLRTTKCWNPNCPICIDILLYWSPPPPLHFTTAHTKQVFFKWWQAERFFSLCTRSLGLTWLAIKWGFLVSLKNVIYRKSTC